MIDRIRDVTSRGWFALYTKSRSEFKAAEQIGALNIEYYLPVITKYRQWSDRRKKITEPLIRGYIFVYVNEKERIKSLEQNAVVRCLTERGRPAKIPDWQIENLKNMLKNEADFYITEGLVPGTKVRIVEGPFEGVIGVVSNIEEGRTIAVSIDLLNRSVIAHLPRESLFEIVK
jgi:transcription antitermination factor NusG